MLNAAATHRVVLEWRARYRSCRGAIHCETRLHPVVGILIRNRLGIDVFGTNTRVEQIELGEFIPGRPSRSISRWSAT